MPIDMPPVPEKRGNARFRF
uniref:Uncharacterized protein n=1 Tax=Arundo donax TaxID=35708 RepID=A0A0A9GSQ2_ARUDO